MVLSKTGSGRWNAGWTRRPTDASMQIRACLSSAARYHSKVSWLLPTESPKGSNSPASRSLPTNPPAKPAEATKEGDGADLGATNFFTGAGAAFLTGALYY